MMLSDFIQLSQPMPRSALKPGGRLYFELNPLTSDELLRQMKQQSWDEVAVLPDMHGKKRFLTARK